MSTDNLANDLLAMLEDCRDHNLTIDETELMMRLTSYIVRRDHKVFNHAYQLGKGRNENKDNQEKQKIGIAS